MYYDNQLLGLAQNTALQNGVPPDLFTSLIAGESGFSVNAYNQSSHAMGLGQILPSTAANPGYGISPLANPYDASSNLNFAAQYLKALYNRTGSWIGAIASYSGTPAGQLPYAGNNQQNNILNAAFNADTGVAGNQSGVQNVSFWDYLNHFIPGASLFGPSITGGNGDVTGGVVSQYVTPFLSRIAVGALGLIIIAGGIFAVTGKSPITVIGRVANGR